MKQHSVKIALVAGFLLVVWWLWPSQNAQQSGQIAGDLDPARSDAVSSGQLRSASAATKSSADSVASKKALSKKARSELTQRFAEVNQMIADERADSAMTELKSMIEEYPGVIEPYINLAALQSKSNQLELARETLNKGIEANRNTALLFESRQTVLGVQAARAYQKALNEPVNTSEPVLLPFIASVEVPVSTLSDAATKSLQDELTRLSGQLSEVQLEKSQLEQIKIGLEKDKSELVQANGKLELERTSFERDEASFDQYKVNLERDKKGLAQANIDLIQTNKTLAKDKQALEIEKQSLEQSAKALSDEKSALERDKSTLANTVEALRKSNNDLLAKITDGSQDDKRTAANGEAANQAQADEIKQLQSQVAANQLALKESQQLLAKTRKELDQSEVEVARLRREVSDNAVVASVDSNANSTKRSEPTKAPVVNSKVKPSASDMPVGQQVQRVIERVKSWAADWSAQDVNGYVSHYTDNYTPPRGSLTHQQWLEQREIRLTNKSFINVDVSDFQGQRRGDKLVVTFSQHYRSNTVDDKIVKRLVFANNNLDWSNAKIVDEVVVSR